MILAPRPRWLKKAPPHVLLILLLASCGPPRGEPAALLLAEREVTAPGTCGAFPRPAHLPGADLLVDSTRLARRVVEHAAAADLPAEGTLTLAMSYDEAGLNIRREIVAHTLPPLLADTLQKMVFAEVRRPDELPEPLDVRLVLQVPDARMEVQRSVYCPPRPRDPRVEGELHGLDAVAAGVRYRRGVRERNVIMRVLVAPAGYVLRVEVVRGGTVPPSTQRSIWEQLRQHTFHPALLDGRPVEGWIEMPFRIRD
jgi:hypothetical protein